jgi:hypothetical protein
MIHRAKMEPNGLIRRLTPPLEHAPEPKLLPSLHRSLKDELVMIYQLHLEQYDFISRR